MKQLTSKIINYGDLLFEIILINCCMILGVLAGLFILGIGPSIIAGGTVIKEILKKNHENMFFSFWKTYWKEWKQANVLTVPILVVLYMFYLNWQIFSSIIFLKIMMVGVITIFVAVVMILYPMYLFYDVEIKRYFFKASQFAFRFIFSSVILLFWGVVCVYVTYLFPVFAFVFSFSVWLLGDIYLCFAFFRQNETALLNQSIQIEKNKNTRKVIRQNET